MVPSISFPVVELRKIAAVQSYEERMLFFVLLLADPTVRVVYATSEAIDPATIEYYLRFLPDPDDARRRLALVSVGDPSIGSLSAKFLARPDDLGPAAGRHRRRAGWRRGHGALQRHPGRAGPGRCPGSTLCGPRPELVWLGSKSGSRQVAMEAGVPVLPGAEDVFSVAELTKAVNGLREVHPDLPAVVVKLNNGFSGQGNAIIDLDGLADPITASPTVFCAGEESWTSFEPKIEDEGAIVEEVVRADDLRSPSVQLQISPTGEVEVLSTHDQILGGPENQVYLGCRFPARPEYRLAILAEARKVAAVMVARGVTGVFGIDFLVDGDPDEGGRVTLSEINLRMGGTTHPFWMVRLATGGTYDQESGELRVPGGEARSYVATDNIKSAQLVGCRPAEVIARIDEAGLAYEPSTRCGVTLHLLGALPGAGKMGVTCIAATPEAADEMYRGVLTALDAR